MKKLLSIILAISLLLFPTSVYASDNETDFDVDYDYIINHLPDKLEDIEGHIDYKYISSYTIGDNLTCCAVLNENELGVMIKDDEKNTLVYVGAEKTNNKYNIIEVKNVSRSNAEKKQNIDLNGDRVTNQKTEPTWNYGYYYNTSAAYLDVYWRLYCPDGTVTSNYFFTEYQTYEQAQCDTFVESVNEMEAKRFAADSQFTQSIVNGMISTLNLMSAFPSHLQIILVVLAASAQPLDSDIMIDLYEAKETAYTSYQVLLD